MPWSWLIPAGASLLGGLLSSRGQQQAASTQAASSTEAASIQAASAQQALNLQDRLAQEQVARNAPTVQAGDTARNRMLDLIGLSGRTGAAGYGSANQPYSMPGFDPNSLMQPFSMPGFDPNSLMQSFSMPGFDPNSLMQSFSMPGFDPNSLMRNFGSADLEADVIRQDALKNANRMTDRSLASRGLFQSPQRAMAEMSNRLNTGEGALRRFQENKASQAGLYSDAFNRFQENKASQAGLYSDAFNRFQTNRGNQAGLYTDAFNRDLKEKSSRAGLFTDAYNRDRTRQMDEYGRLSDFTTRGANAAAGTGTSQAAYGSNAANLMSQGAQAMGQGVLGAGQATAAGQMGAGNTYNNAINSALQGYKNNQMMDLFRNRRSTYDAPYNANTFIPMQPGGGY